MSGSSSTIRTRYGGCEASLTLPAAARAGSFIDDFYLFEVIGVLGQTRPDTGRVVRLGTLFEHPADVRDRRETVRIADPLHTVADPAHLIEVARGERGAQRFELGVPVLEKHRDQVDDVLIHDSRVLVRAHGLEVVSGSGTGDSGCRA